MPGESRGHDTEGTKSDEKLLIYFFHASSSPWSKVGGGWGGWAPAALGSSAVTSPSSAPGTDAAEVGLGILKQEAGREQFLTASGWCSL